jgi:hypothetical protein
MAAWELGGGIYTTTVGSKSGGNGQCKLKKEKRERWGISIGGSFSRGILVVEDCPERSFHPDSVDLCGHLVGTSYWHRRPKLIGMNALHKRLTFSYGARAYVEAR